MKVTLVFTRHHLTEFEKNIYEKYNFKIENLVDSYWNRQDKMYEAVGNGYIEIETYQDLLDFIKEIDNEVVIGEDGIIEIYNYHRE